MDGHDTKFSTNFSTIRLINLVQPSTFLCYASYSYPADGYPHSNKLRLKYSRLRTKFSTQLVHTKFIYIYST
eukprot:SAG31_NODE_24731_length_475_cov_0.837766_1_plen_72_part_00